MLVNVFDVRITSLINAISAYWHVIGVLIIVFACIIVPDHHQSASYVFGQTSTTPASPATAGAAAVFWMVFAIGSIGMAQYTLTGYDASAHMSEETHKASRSAAVGMIWAVIVSVDRRLHPARRDHVRDPEPDRGAGAVHLHHDLHLADVDGHALGRGAALHRRRGAVLLPDRVPHVRLADAVRVLARPRRSRPPGRGGTVSRHRVPGLVAAVGRPRSGFLLLLPTWWNNLAGYYVGTSVGTTGLYIAFILPVILRFRPGDELRARRLEPRQALQVDQPRSRSLWVVFISVVFMLPTAPAASRGTRPGTGTSPTTRRSRSAARSCSSAAGGCSRRTSGSRARCGWAPTRSSKPSRRSRRSSSCSRPTRPTRRPS